MRDGVFNTNSIPIRNSPEAAHMAIGKLVPSTIRPPTIAPKPIDILKVNAIKAVAASVFGAVRKIQV